MAAISEVSDVIGKIADGFKEEVAKCMAANKNEAVELILEQLYSGLDGNGEHLSPTYDDDPFFEEPGRWYHRNEQYKRWKQEITPPESGLKTSSPARPTNVPNLFITGPFYDSIKADIAGDGLEFKSSGMQQGGEIVSKYGSQILDLNMLSRDYFVFEHLEPWLEDFYRRCGW